MNGHQCDLKGPREVERGFVLIFSQCFGGNDVRATCYLGEKSEIRVVERSKSMQRADGRVKMSLQERLKRFGNAPQRIKDSSDHPSRESALPEISHQLGIFGNLH